MIQRVLWLVLFLAITCPAFALEEAGLDWEIQEEYEQLGHIGPVRTAATTPRGVYNVEAYFRLLNDDVVDVWTGVVEFELGLHDKLDIQAGIEGIRTEDFGPFGDESGVGRPFFEFTVQIHDDPGRRQKMATGVRVELEPIEKDLSGDEIIVEPFFVVNQQIGNFDIFFDLGASLESGNSHVDANVGARLPLAENADVVRGPLDWLLAFNFRLGEDSVIAVTSGIETAPSWFPGDLGLGITLGLSDDAFDWGLVLTLDFEI